MAQGYYDRICNTLQIDPDELSNLYDCEEERKYYWLPTQKSINSCPNDSKQRGNLWKDQYYTDYLSNDYSSFADSADHFKLDSFLFYIFSDRTTEAKKLCHQFKNPHMACLIAAKIYRKAARLVSWQNYKRSYYLRNQAEEYSRLAAQIIDEIHRRNCANRKPKELLLKHDKTFFNYTPWELISRSYCHSFHESDLIRKYVQTIWYNGMDEYQRYINFRIFLTTILFPLVPLFLLIPGFIPFRKQINWFKKLKIFFTAPIVQFYYYYIFFIGFLIIDGYAIMMAYFPLNRYGEIRHFPLTRSEIIIHVWTFHLIIEEILEFIESYCRHHNFCSYFHRPWNCLDFITITFYLLAVILRIPPSEGSFVISKILMCLAFILWCTRLLRVFTIFKLLGWCLFLIFRMMKAFVFFFSFILINIFAFSIAVKALLITKEQVTWYYSSTGKLLNATVTDGGNGDGYEMFDWIEIKRLFDWGIWKVFGEIQNADLDYEDAFTIVAWWLTIIFVCLTNIVLLSTLIILLNIIGDNTKEKSKILQRYEHFLIIMEFSDKDKLPSIFLRSLVPPPLNVVWYIIHGVLAIFNFLYSLRSPISHQETYTTETVFDSFKEDPYLLITYTCVSSEHKHEQITISKQFTLMLIVFFFF